MAAVPIVVVGPSATLGGLAGRLVQLKNFGPALLASVTVVLTTTATVGNRIPVLQVQDPSSNVLWSATPAAVVAASTQVRIAFGSGIQAAAALAGSPFSVASLSDQMVLPPNSQLFLFDQANIDVNDVNNTVVALLSVGG